MARRVAKYKGSQEATWLYIQNQLENTSNWSGIAMRVGVNQYKTNALYPRIVNAVSECLEFYRFVAPAQVFISLNYLSNDDLQRWRLGQIDYLEKAIKCNLSKASTILRILRFHGHDLNLSPSVTVYKHKSKILRFTKTGDENLENAYSTHLIKQGKINMPKDESFDAKAVNVIQKSIIDEFADGLYKRVPKEVEN